MLPAGVAEADLTFSEPVIVALSGGGDSMSLLHLLAPRCAVRAVIVDHGLRPDSAEEAACVAQRAQAIGICAQVVRLAWREDEKRTQANMRAKRYAALCAAAREAEARLIALGHTMDDQAETLMLRAAAGSGWRGLAGMARLAPAPLWPEGRDLLVARPLLGARRRALRDWLGAHAIAWIEDPANENEAFARVRVRRALAQTPELPARLARLAALLRRRAERLDRSARAWLDAAACVRTDAVRLDLAAPAPDHVRIRALEALLAAVGAAARPPAPAAVRRLLRALEGADFAGATLGGCRIAPGAGLRPLREGQVDLRPETGPRRRGLPLMAVRRAAQLDPEAVRARLSHILFTPP